MKIIPLTQGIVTIVDDADFERLSQHEWLASYIHNHWYAVRLELRDSSRTTIYMHRELLSAPKTFQVDHIHRDDEFGVIDNRRGNLRLATRFQNNANRKNQKESSSAYKGVGWYKAYKCWRAKIQVNHRSIHLGYFSDEKEAALAYDSAAKRYFGEFAHLNFTQPA